MEEIDLKELLEFIKNKKYVLIGISLLVLIIGCVYSFSIKTPLYKSSATIVLAKEENTTTSVEITQNEVALNQKLVSTYTEIVKSRKVLSEVIDNLQLNESYEDLNKKVSVQAVENTEIIKISVEDKEAQRSQKITNEISKVFSTQVTEIYNVKNVQILDEASYSNIPSNISYIKEPVIYTLIGVILGLTILFGIFYIDNTIKTVEQVEAKLGLPILGRIPQYNKSKHKKHKKGRE